MDVYHGFRGGIFCWNAEKAATNLAKHGISFERACEVFADNMHLIEDATVDDEARSVAIGITLDWKLTCVVHLSREDGLTRIISARQATVTERSHYENCK